MILSFTNSGDNTLVLCLYICIYVCVLANHHIILYDDGTVNDNRGAYSFNPCYAHTKVCFWIHHTSSLCREVSRVGCGVP